MTAGDGYFTLGARSCEEVVERKSRFIAQVSPVFNEEDALSFIKAVKESHKTAGHHCFAYIIGINAGLMRYQDDGEPQGTAGIPILEVLKKTIWSIASPLSLDTSAAFYWEQAGWQGHTAQARQKRSRQPALYGPKKVSG